MANILPIFRVNQTKFDNNNTTNSMGDFAVDDWESLIDKDVEEIKASTQAQVPKQQQPPSTVPTKPSIEKVQTKKEKTANEEVIIQQPQDDKPKPLTNEQKRKAELLSRLANETLIDDLFEGLSLENKKASSAQIILKNEKSFQQFAKTVSERFDEDAPSEFLEDFGVELLINLYPLMTSPQLREIQQKLGVLKNQKKKEEKKKKKQVKKEPKKEQGEAKKPEKEELLQKEKDPRYVPGMEDFM